MKWKNVMNRLFFLILILFINLLYSCDADCENHFTARDRYIYISTSTTIFQPFYDPDWSNAKITKRYNAEIGHFANWQDGHIMVVNQTDLKIFDLSNDTAIKKNQINLNKSDLSGDWTSLKCYGIADIGEKYLLLARLDNTTDSLTTFLSVNNDGNDFCISHLAKDLKSSSKPKSIYYNSSTRILTVVQSDNIWSQYIYDSSSDSLMLDSFKNGEGDWLTKSYSYKNVYSLSTTNPSVYKSTLFFYKAAESYRYHHTVYPHYLGMSEPVISCFDDGKDIYLFIKDNEQYKFVLIKAKWESYIL